MTSITWAGPRCVLELANSLGPQNRTQGRCDHVFTTCRYACSIEVPDSGELVVTGGGDSAVISRVQVYSIKGAKQRLPDLQQPRKIHACSYDYDDRNEMVDKIISIVCLCLSILSPSV